MDDRFLHEQRREPAPGFSRALRERLRGTETESPARGFRLHPALGTALATALVAASFTLPAVRVAAQNALDLFRVHSFAAVEISASRIEQLKKLHDQVETDPTMMVFDKQETLKDPGKPVEYPSADLAGAAAGLPGLRKPTSLPSGLVFDKAAVTGQGAARLTLHADRLQHVLDALGITDVRVPSGLDGQSITVHMPASVMQLYASGKRRLSIIEGTSPEVALPPGADLQQLGEIGLRVLGLDAVEARRIAGSIDWRSTLLVPVPTTAASFRQVDVNGHKGLFIRMEGDGTSESPKDRRGAMVMWTDGERVLAVQSNLPNEDVLEVAQSLR
jgi:hypothetical protein